MHAGRRLQAAAPHFCIAAAPTRAIGSNSGWPLPQPYVQCLRPQTACCHARQSNVLIRQVLFTWWTFLGAVSNSRQGAFSKTLGMRYKGRKALEAYCE